MDLEPAMARLIDIAARAVPAFTGVGNCISTPRLDLSLLLRGPWAA
jgi:hypothetical protein